MDHAQGATPLQLDNKCAICIINDEIQQNHRHIWTCLFTGCAIDHASGKSTNIGITAVKMMLTIQVNTTQRNIT